MIKVGLREANMHFSKYIKLARQGNEVVVTDRGAPIAVIKPLAGTATAGERVKALEEQGILMRARGKAGALPRPISVKGKPMSRTVSEERDER
ncbi:MAG: type II toxin-antitoxin system prevent-host-death family antitoxin [Nitrospirota bacterium]